MKFNIATQFIIGYYLFVLVFWSILYTNNIRSGEYCYYYQFAFGLVPIFGGIFGITKSRQWGYFSSKVGKSIIFISLGLLTWGIGQMFWSIFYNIILKVEIPYPSLADYFYILSWPLWATGIIYLSKAAGAHVSLKRMSGKLLLFTLPAFFIFLSYYLLIYVAREKVLSDFKGGYFKIFFDLAYPLGDVVILSTAGLIYGLSFRYLGGRYKWPITLILFAFVLNYFTDFAFAYTTTTKEYYNGHWVDILYPTILGIIGIGVNNFEAENE